MDWERSAIEAAAAYFRELIDAGITDSRTESVYEGLLDILDAGRHAMRIQRAVSADAAIAIMRAGRDRRNPMNRRGEPERRLTDLGPLSLDERRSGALRRSGQDRRVAVVT
ncbi:MAG TPA: hypothetical protein VLV86_00930 [Vicinamibacterales bacterium]|nr:hypothetical protein [Vicinamibacterales bacterium]